MKRSPFFDLKTNIFLKNRNIYGFFCFFDVFLCHIFRNRKISPMENRLIQEKAIRIFEEQFHCRLCCHDYSGQLQGVPLPQYHLNPFCTGLKEHKNKLTELCIEFDRDKVQHQLLRTHPRPFFKCCLRDAGSRFPDRCRRKALRRDFRRTFPAAPGTGGTHQSADTQTSTQNQASRFKTGTGGTVSCLWDAHRLLSLPCKSGNRLMSRARAGR